MLFALTPTHDTDERVERVRDESKDPGKYLAFFGYDEKRGAAGSKDVFAESPLDYNWTDLDDRSNIMIDQRGSGGITTPDFTSIGITQPSKHTELAQEEFRKTGKHLDSLKARLKHETQHTSDFELFSTGIGWQPPTGLAAGGAKDPFLEFKTEYRAYWAQEEGFEPTDEELSKGRLVASGVQLSPKQFKIMNAIINNYQDVKSAWEKNSTLPDGRFFKDAVVDFAKKPFEDITYNPNNSLRVHRFLQAVAEKQPVEALRASFFDENGDYTLDPNDLEVIRREPEVAENLNLESVLKAHQDYRRIIGMVEGRRPTLTHTTKTTTTPIPTTTASTSTGTTTTTTTAPSSRAQPKSRVRRRLEKILSQTSPTPTLPPPPPPLVMSAPPPTISEEMVQLPPLPLYETSTTSTPVSLAQPLPNTPASLPPQSGGIMTTARTGYEGWSIADLLEEQQRLTTSASSSVSDQLAAVSAELRKYGFS
jgi:hypothetical protein